MNFYIADMQVSHSNVIKYDYSPFEELNKKNRTLIENWNARVKNDGNKFC